MAYATGKYAQAECDRCGFVYPYNRLRLEWTNLKVCPECFETKAHQLEPQQLGTDKIALFEPRVQKGLAESRRLGSFNPVGSRIGSPYDLDLTAEVGSVTITTTSS